MIVLLPNAIDQHHNEPQAQMKQVGTTTDNRIVVDGVFRLMDTVGLPLDIIVQELKDRNLVPAWDEFILDAKNAGWKGKTIRES